MGTLIDDLSQGRTLVETHISWVFMDECDVYKLKKPVNLGFLDFTTLERRHAACLAEVRLNSRLTDEVYLGVKPVTCNALGHYQLDGAGPVVDYCVHMRRLSDEDRLDVVLEAGSLTPATLRALSAHLAQFHGSAATNEDIARYGAQPIIRQNVVENFAQTRDHIAEFISEEQAARLERSQMALLERHASLFSRRVREGRVRDGHGDLRLEHVYYPNQHFQILDCIEFNERFRYADVCADLAFLTMDLRHCCRSDLAEVLLAGYAAEACDFELYSLIDFYESYRAVVRAKVNSFLATDPRISEAQRMRAHRETERYLRQALEATASRSPGVVVAVGGLIAAGKSHTCELLADLLTCPVVSTDRIRKHLLDVPRYAPLHDSGFSGAYSASMTARTYESVRQQAAHVIGSGRNVVLDGTFRDAQERATLRGWAASLGAKLLFVECVAPEHVLRNRLRQRAKGPSVSDGREEIFDDFLRSYSPPDELEPSQRCTLDTTLPLSEQCAKLGTFLATRVSSP